MSGISSVLSTNCHASSFENFLQKLKKLVRSRQNPIVQLAKRQGELSSSNPKPVVKQSFTVVSTKLKDSCFLLSGKKYTFVKEVRDDGRFVCCVLPQPQTDNFYEIPVESKLFGISYLKDLTKATKRCLLEKDDLFVEGYMPSCGWWWIPVDSTAS